MNDPSPPDPTTTPPAADAPVPLNPDAEPTKVELPPAPPPTPARWPGWLTGFDVGLAVLVVALAFMLASFAARNADAWRHLAAGRLLAAGGYSFGADPFSYTGADRVWVNHAWLFDLGSYLLYSAGGGFALVLAKAVAVAAAFGLLFLVRRPGTLLWPWVLAATLAVLAVAPALALRSQVASVVFLAATLAALFRLPAAPGSWRLPAVVGVLFWLWASSDAWFVLGPLAVALLLAGELIQRVVAARPADADLAADPLGPGPGVGTLAKTLAVGVVACSLTPHHVRVWQLPAELTADAGELSLLPAGSPLTGAFFDRVIAGSDLNGLAFFVLFVGTSVALGFGAARRHVAYLPLWLGFAALSLYTAAAVPFLAVVGVPLAAAQLGALAGRLELGPRGEPRARALTLAAVCGRLGAAFVLVLMLGAAWPGWLHHSPRPRGPEDVRRVAWAVDADPSLKAAAERIEGWRAAGGLTPADRGLSGSVDLADYCAWFAPSERVFFNSRYGFHRPEWPEYAGALTRLQVRGTPEDAAKATPLAETFAARGIVYVSLHDPHRDFNDSPLRRIWTAPHRWATWHLGGRAAVVAWVPAGGLPARLSGLALDPGRAAFGPGQPHLPPGPEAAPFKPAGWEDDYLRPARPAPADAFEALAWIGYKDAVVRREAAVQQSARLLFANAALAGLPPVAAARDLAESELITRQTGSPRLRPPADGSLDALPVLAVRAARRAIHDNPDHPDGYYALGLAYLLSGDRELMGAEGCERSAAITALRRCLTRLPHKDEYAAARDRYGRLPTLATPSRVAYLLAQMYLGTPARERTPAGERVRFGGVVVTDGPLAQLLRDGRVVPTDLARQALHLSSQYLTVEAAAGAADERFAQEVNGLLKLVDEELRAGKEFYDANAGRAPKAYNRYVMARQRDLVGQALEVLREADFPKEFGDAAPGVALEKVALELVVGRLEDAASDLRALRDGLDERDRVPGADPRQTAELRRQVRHLEYLILVLEGNYAAAGQALEEVAGPELRRPLAPPPAGQMAAVQALGVAWPLVPMAGAVTSAPSVAANYLIGSLQYAVARAQAGPVSDRMDGEANFYYRRGVLSLLDGDAADARTRFAQTTRRPPPGWNLPTVRHAAADNYLKLIDAYAK